MRRERLRRILVWPLAVLLALTLVPNRGRAALEGVYFTAANEQLLDLTSETMPFYSGGVLYVSSKVFEGTDLGVTFVYNSTTKMAMLYTARTDLRFDLANQTTTDKNGNRYQAYALERNGYVFLPIGTVCGFFGLMWTINETGIAPLIRAIVEARLNEPAGFASEIRALVIRNGIRESVLCRRSVATSSRPR